MATPPMKGVMRKFVFLIIFASFSLTSCGERYRKEAQIYLSAVHAVLIDRGICSNAEDCRSKGVVFWNDGEHIFDFFNTDVTYLFLYNTQSSDIVDAIELELEKVKDRISPPGVVLNVYKSLHGEKKVIFRRTEIR